MTHPSEIDGPRPQCFSPLQWQDWTRMERVAAQEPGYVAEPNGYCTHCTLARQTMMKASSKCKYPTVEFVEVEPGDVIGVRNRACV